MENNSDIQIPKVAESLYREGIRLGWWKGPVFEELGPIERDEFETLVYKVIKDGTTSGFNAHTEMFMHVMSPAIGMARMHPERAKEFLDKACDEMDAWQYTRNPRLAEIMPGLMEGAERHHARMKEIKDGKEINPSASGN